MTRIDDGWKEELLAKPYLTGLELLQLPADRRAWVCSFRHVWTDEFSRHCDALVNLLHRDNWKLAAKYKELHPCRP